MSVRQCEFASGDAGRCHVFAGRQVYGRWLCWRHERSFRACCDMLTSDLAAFVERVVGQEPVFEDIRHDVIRCAWCHYIRDDWDPPKHAPDCPYTQATQLAERITAAGLSVDTAVQDAAEGPTT